MKSVHEILNNYNRMLVSWKSNKKTIIYEILVNKETGNIEYYKEDYMSLSDIGWDKFEEATLKLKTELLNVLNSKLKLS